MVYTHCYNSLLKSETLYFSSKHVGKWSRFARVRGYSKAKKPAVSVIPIVTGRSLIPGNIRNPKIPFVACCEIDGIEMGE